MADATAEDLLSGWKREKKSAEVEGVGTIYYYDPPSVAERDAYYRHIRFDDNGSMSVSLEGIVDGIIARVKDVNSRPLFKQIHRNRMMEEMSEERLMSIWRAIGGDKMKPAGDLSEAAEKK